MQRTLQGNAEGLVDPAHRMDCHRRGDVGRHVGQVLAVVLGDDDRGDAAAVRRQQFLLQSANGQHAPAQGDLTGHRHLGAHWYLGQHRHQRHAHRHARARAVLGRCALGHMDMHVELLVELRIDAERVHTCAHHR